MPDYAKIAKDARLKVLDMIYKAQTSHIGSNFSCIDILTVLFEKIDLSKDRFVLSAGWKAASLYYFLWRKGRITTEELDSYCQEGSKFIGLAEPIIPEIQIAGGSMGLGLPGAVGLALAKKLKGEEGTVYCLMSDGEVAIGTTWESLLIAIHHKLDNLVILIDWNGYQAMGKTGDILKIFMPMGAYRYGINLPGHDFNEIAKALKDKGKPKEGPYSDTPLVLKFNTIKGKGVSFMENQNIYHYKQLSEEEYEKAKKELNGRVDVSKMNIIISDPSEDNLCDSCQ